MAVTIDIALCVKNPAAPQATSIKWKSWLEGRSYVNSVTYEDIDTVTQEQLNLSSKPLGMKIVMFGGLLPMP